jgi:hypothetical protein
MPDERWLLQTELDPEEINRRLEMLVSRKGIRGLLAKRGTAPRVAGAKVAPDWIALTSASHGGFHVGMHVYPPRLAGTIRPNEFVLFPSGGTTPKMEGWLLPRADGTEIELRLGSDTDVRDSVMIAIALASAVWFVFAASFIGKATRGDTRWDLLVPCIVVPLFFAVGYAYWRQTRGTNRQLVELLCEALDASVVSSPPRF